MRHDEIHALLRQSISDGNFSRGETKALKALIDDVGLASGDRKSILGFAFDLAREQAGTPAIKSVLDWLDGVASSLVAAASAGASDARGSTEVHFSPGEDCLRRIGALFQACRESADVCVFTITDDRISDAIVTAHRRGVRVRVVSDDEKASDIGSDVDRLQAAGVPVAFDTSPHHMHHKFAIFDSRTVVSGSYNWTRSAADCNAENILVCDDARALGRFQSEFDRLWQRFARA